MKKIRLLYIIVVMLCLVIQSQAQSDALVALSVGWNEARFIRPLSNIEIPMYQFNQSNPDMVKKYNMPEFFQGLNLDFRVGAQNVGMIFSWSNKHGIARAEGIATGSGDTVYKIRNLKTRFDLFGIGFYNSIYKRLKMGLTLDMGFFKIMKKIAEKEQFDNAKWEAYYDKKGTPGCGVTLSISYPIKISKSFQLRFQPYFQYLWVKDFEVGGTDGFKYYYNPTNFGLTTFISLSSEN